MSRQIRHSRLKTVFKWAGRRSNPRLRFFRPPLDRLSYQPICLCWGTYLFEATGLNIL